MHLKITLGEKENGFQFHLRDKEKSLNSVHFLHYDFFTQYIGKPSGKARFLQDCQYKISLKKGEPTLFMIHIGETMITYLNYVNAHCTPKHILHLFF